MKQQSSSSNGSFEHKSEWKHCDSKQRMAKVVTTMTAAASTRARQPQGQTFKKKQQSTGGECGESKWNFWQDQDALSINGMKAEAYARQQ